MATKNTSKKPSKSKSKGLGKATQVPKKKIGHVQRRATDTLVYVTRSGDVYEVTRNEGRKPKKATKSDAGKKGASISHDRKRHVRHAMDGVKKKSKSKGSPVVGKISKLAKKIRKDGEAWTSAIKRAAKQI